MTDEPELEVEMVTLPYPFIEDDDAKLRCFIAENYMNPEIDGIILIENMQRIEKWIKTGEVPQREKPRSKPTLVKS